MVGILVGLLLGCVVSGVFPLVNAEVLLAEAVAVLAAGLPLAIAAATVRQMLSKWLLSDLARHAPARLPERARKELDRAVAMVTKRGGAAGFLVFSSSGAPRRGSPPSTA